MARYYDDIYFTNCNGKLYIHLDDPTGTSETITNANSFRVRFETYGTIMPSGYPSGYSSCEDGYWLTQIWGTFNTSYTLNNEDDLKIEFDTNQLIEALIYSENSNGDQIDYANSDYVYNWPMNSDCLENNWWKDGLRTGPETKVIIRYYNSSGTKVGTDHVIGTNARSSANNTFRSNGAKYIYNAPDGTSGRAIVSDDNNTYSGYDAYGVTGSPLQSMATTSGCTGDPHVTTFDGCKYTL